MSALSLVTTCPEWCTSKGFAGDGEDGHSGPHWPTLRDDRHGYLSICADMNEKGQIIVSVDSTSPDLTPEQALEAGRYLIEAGQWALAHSVTA